MFSRFGFAFGYVVGAFALAALFGMAAFGCVSAPVRVPATLATAAPLTLVAPFPTLPRGSPMGLATPSVTVESAGWAGGMLSVTVRADAIPGDYLFDAPVLEYAGQSVPATTESLAGARRVFLQLAAQAEVPATLAFDVLDETGAATLIFNPGSLESSLVNPLVWVSVIWPAPTP